MEHEHLEYSSDDYKAAWIIKNTTSTRNHEVTPEHFISFNYLEFSKAYDKASMVKVSLRIRFRYIG